MDYIARVSQIVVQPIKVVAVRKTLGGRFLIFYFFINQSNKNGIQWPLICLYNMEQFTKLLFT